MNCYVVPATEDVLDFKITGQKSMDVEDACVHGLYM